jgi:enoyl-CoA hydratase/carnithine racemase
MTERSMVSLVAEGPIGVVTIDRPEALNAISGALAEELADVFREVGSRPDIWVMILGGAGDRAFCVGADLKERASFTTDDYYSNRRQVKGMFAALRAIPQPTVAAVFGFALGGGLELALSCDLIVASDDIVMGLPEVRVGLIPAGGATQLLTRAVGETKAKEIIFTGRRFEADEAAALGLVTKVVSPVQLETAAMELARDLCRSSPVAVRQAKRAIEAALGTSVDDGIEVEHRSWEEVINTSDRAEGIAAFNEKRDPQWSNR